MSRAGPTWVLMSEKSGIRRRGFMQGLLVAAGGVALGAGLPACDPGGELPAHPYLFFGAGDVEALRRRCAAAMKPQFDALLAYAREHLGDTPPAALQGEYEAR